MRAFVVLGLVFPVPSQKIGLGDVYEMAYCCVGCDVTPCSLALSGYIKHVTVS